jgi:hypothetical protein
MGGEKPSCRGALASCYCRPWRGCCCAVERRAGHREEGRGARPQGGRGDHRAPWKKKGRCGGDGAESVGQWDFNSGALGQGAGRREEEIFLRTEATEQETGRWLGEGRGLAMGGWRKELAAGEGWRPWSSCALAAVAVEQGGRRLLAAKRNGGMGVQNCQVQGKRDPIYRRSPRDRVS